MEFLWIDDQTDRASRYQRLIEDCQVGRAKPKLVAIDVSENPMDAVAAALNRRDPPSLILVDHYYTRQRGVPIRFKGSNIAHLVRSHWPDVPVISVTAMRLEKGKFDQEDLSEYTAIFDYVDFAERLDEVVAIARDFPKLRPSTRDFRHDLIDLLEPPKSERESLLSVMPREFASRQHATTKHRVAQWILGTLMERPGFLYGPLRAATLLGITKPAFDRIADRFARASYSGLFSNASRPRWWVKGLMDLVFDEVPSSGRPQIAGRALAGIATGDYSQCHVHPGSGEVPELVAFTPDGHEVPVCSSCARLDPSSSPIPGFEALYVLTAPVKRRPA